MEINEAKQTKIFTKLQNEFLTKKRVNLDLKHPTDDAPVPPGDYGDAFEVTYNDKRTGVILMEKMVFIDLNENEEKELVDMLRYGILTQIAKREISEIEKLENDEKKD